MKFLLESQVLCGGYTPEYRCSRLQALENHGGFSLFIIKLYASLFLSFLSTNSEKFVGGQLFRLTFHPPFYPKTLSVFLLVIAEEDVNDNSTEFRMYF